MEAIDYLKMTRSLVDVSMGRASADLVIRGGRWVCVQSGEIIPETDIAVSGSRIAYVGPDASHTIGSETQVIEASQRYLVPGLLDGHVHVESGMLTVTEFVRAVIPHGTTGLFVDPHEVANVLGMRGVRMMVDEAALQPIHVWVEMPSCIPAASGLETSGAEIGPDEVAEAMTWEGIIGLGEMMNFPGVAAGDEKMLAEMAETRLAGKVIGGHYASPDLGLAFHAYVAGGAEDDHEGTRKEDAIARVRQGMKVMMRYGSGWHDVATQIRAVTEEGLDPRHFILVTDDCHSETLVSEGHMDRVLRHAMQQGIEPMTAIQMATLNTAEHFGVAREVGQIAPGRFADVLLVNDLRKMEIDTVVAKGAVIHRQGAWVLDLPAFPYPSEVKSSVHIPRDLTEDDFVLRTSFEGPVTVHVIGVVENQAPTRHLQLRMEASQGRILIDPTEDLARVALVERHKGSGRVQVGLVQGFGFEGNCAVASTVAHDSHHMLIVGTQKSDMAVAANRLAQMGGGQIVIKEGEAIAQVELPIAGLMSDEHAERVASKARAVLEGFRACGCELANPNMQLSLLGLVVIPALRISDRGLVDVNRFEVIPFVEQSPTG